MFPFFPPPGIHFNAVQSAVVLIMGNDSFISSAFNLLLTSHRINFLQSLIAEHGQFDELLLSFSDWIKQFLAELQATSEINTADQQLAASHNKVNFWI